MGFFKYRAWHRAIAFGSNVTPSLAASGKGTKRRWVANGLPSITSSAYQSNSVRLAPHTCGRAALTRGLAALACAHLAAMKPQADIMPLAGADEHDCAVKPTMRVDVDHNRIWRAEINGAARMARIFMGRLLCG